MPIYEYRCAACGRKTTVLTLSIGASAEPQCVHCGGAELVKLVSRVAFLRSEEDRLDSLADPSSLSGLDENDPRSVARWVKKMGREMGEDLGEGFDEEVDRAAAEAESGVEDDDEPASGGESGGEEF